MVHAADSPSARIGPAMVYDSVNERVLLFGGAIYDNGYSFYNDLWSFKDGVWTEIDVPGTKPSGRFNIPMVYLPDTQQIFIYGGFSDQDRIGDTWLQGRWRSADRLVHSALCRSDPLDLSGIRGAYGDRQAGRRDPSAGR